MWKELFNARKIQKSDKSSSRYREIKKGRMKEMEKLQTERKHIAWKAERVPSSWPLGARVPASLAALSFEPGAVFREERKSTQIPQKELFWQGSGLPPTAASSSLLPSSIHLWGAAYSPSPTPHNKTWTSILRRRADMHTCTHKRLLCDCRHKCTCALTWAHGVVFRVCA